jgi:hypothetical protein
MYSTTSHGALEILNTEAQSESLRSRYGDTSKPKGITTSTIVHTQRLFLSWRIAIRHTLSYATRLLKCLGTSIYGEITAVIKISLTLILR